MSTKIIVSYDGTNNENDAIALGRLFAQAGAEISLAYVVHNPQPGDQHEFLGDREANGLLERGAQLLGDSEAARHIVTDRSTPAGLSALAEREDANVIVFCSDSHTAPGHVAIGNSAQRLLDGGRVAIAVAPAGLAQREAQIRRIAATQDPTDASAQETAQALAGVYGAQVSAAVEGHGADLLVVGSRPEAGEGQVAVSAAHLNLIENASGAVLVVPRATAVRFGRPVLSAA